MPPPTYIHPSRDWVAFFQAARFQIERGYSDRPIGLCVPLRANPLPSFPDEGGYQGRACAEGFLRAAQFLVGPDEEMQDAEAGHTRPCKASEGGKGFEKGWSTNSVALTEPRQNVFRYVKLCRGYKVRYIYVWSLVTRSTCSFKKQVCI